jgi:RND family efflux transporter MFP subunit
LLYVRATDAGVPVEEVPATPPPNPSAENKPGRDNKPPEFIGIIVSREQDDVKSTLTGKVATVHVVIGDKVKAGDALVTLDESAAANQVEAARSARRRAEGNLTAAVAAAGQARLNLKSARKLAETGAGSVSDVENAESSLRIASANVTSAKAALDEAKSQEKQAETVGADVVIRTRFDGDVTAIYVNAGTLLATGAPVARVLNPEKLKVAFLVKRRDASLTPVGKPIFVQPLQTHGALLGAIETCTRNVDEDLAGIICEGSVVIPENRRDEPWVNEPVYVSVAAVIPGQ